LFINALDEKIVTGAKVSARAARQAGRNLPLT